MNLNGNNGKIVNEEKLFEVVLAVKSLFETHDLSPLECELVLKKILMELKLIENYVFKKTLLNCLEKVDNLQRPRFVS